MTFLLHRLTHCSSLSMKLPAKGKTPLSLAVIIIAVVALMSVTFTEDLRALTGISTLKPKEAAAAATAAAAVAPSSVERDVGLREASEAVMDEGEEIEFRRKNCSATEGKWVFNSSKEVLYTDQSCPYLDKQLVCKRNGRPEDKYLYWEWEMDDCTLPRFNVEIVLRKLRGKRLMFVGDSLQRAQWQSFVCMVQAHIPRKRKLMKRNGPHCLFKAKDYNATIEFHWAPFLVESNTDERIVPNPNERIVRVDSVAAHARRWAQADILVFSSYMWWMTAQTIKCSWGSFGNEGHEDLDVTIAYRLGLQTWANWVDSTVNPNTTRVFFATMSPAHTSSWDWGKKDGIQCYNETVPVARRGFVGSGVDWRIVQVMADVVESMKKVPVTVLNVTQLSDYRIDAHVSVYTQLGGKVLSDEQKNDPLRYADCIHWCLPGVPDTWNQLLNAYL